MAQTRLYHALSYTLYQDIGYARSPTTAEKQHVSYAATYMYYAYILLVQPE